MFWWEGGLRKEQETGENLVVTYLRWTESLDLLPCLKQERDTKNPSCPPAVIEPSVLVESSGSNTDNQCFFVMNNSRLVCCCIVASHCSDWTEAGLVADRLRNSECRLVHTHTDRTLPLVVSDDRNVVLMDPPWVLLNPLRASAFWNSPVMCYYERLGPHK